ncbi:MAG TPA: glycosyltransferase [Nevskiaceae bacterium]|nr:glycosyltransferase [Nevskiaceae bacterium]
MAFGLRKSAPPAAAPPEAAPATGEADAAAGPPPSWHLDQLGLSPDGHWLLALGWADGRLEPDQLRLAEGGPAAWISRHPRPDVAAFLRRGETDGGFGFLAAFALTANQPIGLPAWRGQPAGERTLLPATDPGWLESLRAVWPAAAGAPALRAWLAPAESLPGARLRGHLDLALLLPEGELLLSGWCYQLDEQPIEATLVDLASGAERPVSACWSRVERADVYSGIRHLLPAALHTGFVVRVPPALLGPASQLHLLLGDGSRDLSLPVSPRTLAPQEVLPVLLGLFRSRQTEGLVDLLERQLGAPLGAAQQRRQPPRSSALIEAAPCQPASAPRLSLLLPVFSASDPLRVVLAGLMPLAGRRDLEWLIGVDDPLLYREWSEQLPEWTASYGLRLRLLGSRGTLGYAALLNQLAAVAQGEFLGLLDADLLLPSEDWLAPLLHPLLADPACGASGPLLLHRDGALASAGEQLEALPGLAPLQGPRALDRRPPAVAPVPGLPSCGLFTRRAEFLAAGGLDAGYLGESLLGLDYCQRLARQGRHSVVVPSVALTRLGLRDATLQAREPRHGDPALVANVQLYDCWRLQQREGAEAPR